MARETSGAFERVDWGVKRAVEKRQTTEGDRLSHQARVFIQPEGVSEFFS
jgi:hypothetical protein